MKTISPPKNPDLISLYDSFVFNLFKEHLKKDLSEIKEDILQIVYEGSVNVFYKKKPVFIYPTFQKWIKL